MRHELTLTNGLPARAYAAACIVAPILGGLGSGLIWEASGFPAAYTVKMALGGALFFVANGLLVSLLVSQRDLDSRRKLNQAIQERMTPPAPDGYSQLYASEVPTSEYISEQEDDGFVALYDIQVTRAQLEKLVEVSYRPKAGIVYDDFARHPNKVCSQGELRKMQNDLADQHLAVRTAGERFYLTERGRRIVRRKMDEANRPPSGMRIPRIF